MSGERGDVWVIGAQNAGKSSLVNALRRVASGKSAGEEGLGPKDITVAPLPGTTLGEHRNPKWPRNLIRVRNP